MAKKSKSKTKKSESQKELVMVMVLSLFLGAGGGFAIGAFVSSGDSDSTNSSSTMKDSGHSHSMFMVSADEAPSVELVVSEDAKSGYNVTLLTENFEFAPEKVNTDNVVGEGHAHLYVDGEKVGRLYGPDFHYDGAFEGTKTFSATLNSNMHGEYAVDGDVIDDSVEVSHDSGDPSH